MGSDLNQLEIDRSNVTGILQQFQSDNSLGFRVRTIVNNNPYMASNMDAVMQMAQSDYSDLDIHRNSGAIYGAITADTLKSQLQNYDESIQRSIFANLTPQQQGALNQQGYEQPKADTSDNDGFFRDALGLIAKPIGMAVRGAGSVPGVTGLAKGGLKVLEEVSNVPGWLYRSAVNQTWEERLIGLAAAGVTVAGFLAAPTTGGVSAAAGVGARSMLLRLLARPALGVAVKGLTAVVAANVAQGASQVLTGNADDWWHTFSDAKNGERFFKIGSVKQAEELLQDSRLTNLATKISMEFDDFSLLNVTKDVAETGKLTAQMMQSIADDMADPGTDENKQLVETLTSLLENPIFQEAVEILQKGKISLGRSIASTLQFDEDGDMYRYISGSVDAASWFVFDPFMAASKIQKSSKILRLGFANIDAANEVNLLDRFLVIAKEPEIRRSYEIFAESINTSNTALRDRFVPWLRSVEGDYRAFLLAENKGAATADNFVEWVTGSNQLKMIMQGKGIVHGSKTAVMLKGVTKGQEARKAYVTGPVKDFIDGIQFSDNLRVLSKTPLGKSGVSAVAQVDEMMNSSYINALPEIEKLRLGNALNPRAFAAGEAVNRLPGAKMFANLVTDMSTLVAGKSALLDSPEDVKRFVDLFAAGQVPKHVRDLWITAINGEQGVAAKLNAVDSFYETIFNATGLTSTPKGFEFAEEFLMHSKKVYHVGPLGATDGVPQTVLQNNTAVKIHLPELHEIRKAVDAEVVTRHLLNIVENPWISTTQRRFWKPSVLLRVGFITRNASEDMIGFIARNGIGHLTQEFASRSVVKGVIAESIPAAAKAGAALTPAQLSAVAEKFAIMSWMRPIEHIMSRFQGDVVNHFLVKQTASIRQVLNKGFKGGALQDHPLAYWAAGIDPRSMTEGFSLTNAQIKANAAMQKLALGGKYSARRMLLGGVDNELYNSSKEFMQTYQKVLMDQIGSSTTMVPYAGQFSNNLQVSISGSFDIIPSSAEGSLEAMVKNMQHHMSDPGFRFVADNHALYLPPEIAKNVSPDQLRDLLKNWKALEFDENDSLFDIYTILTEKASTHSGVLNTTSPERWQMLVAHLEKRGVELKLIKRLKTKFQGEKVPTWEDFVFENAGGGGWGRTTRSQQQYDDLVNFHDAHIATISDDVTRGHIKANLLLDNTTGGTHLSLEEINAMGGQSAQGVAGSVDFPVLNQNVFGNDVWGNMPNAEAKAFAARGQEIVDNLGKTPTIFDDGEYVILVHGGVSSDRLVNGVLDPSYIRERTLRGPQQRAVEEMKENRYGRLPQNLVDELNASDEPGKLFATYVRVNEIEATYYNGQGGNGLHFIRVPKKDVYTGFGGANEVQVFGKQTPIASFQNQSPSQLLDVDSKKLSLGYLEDQLLKAQSDMLVNQGIGKADNLYGPFTLDKTLNDKRLKDAALLQINERTGSFANLPQLKQFEDKAVGTRVHVIDFADNSNTFLDPDLLIGSLLKTDGSVDISGLANALGLDSTVMSLTQQKNLEGIVQDILDAIIKKDKLILHTPQLRQSSDVTDSIHKYLDEIFQSKFNRKIMKPKSANIPIDDMNQLKTRYPTVGAFKPSVNFGTNGQIKLRTAKWDSATYPLAAEYLTAATGDIGNEKIIDDLIKLYQDMTQSHVRMSMKTRDKIIYEKVGSQYVAIAPDTELYNIDKKLFFSDAKGKTPLKLGNQSYFEQHVLDYGPNSETLHSFVQPAHYDEIMNARGTILREPTLGSQKKYWDMNPVTKQVTEREVVVDYTKSITLNESHLANLPAEYLPNYTIKSLEEAADLGTWDKIVQGGFKYMGASIDAIARRPMAFHAFHQARLRNQKNIEWLFTNTSANIQLGQAIDDAIANKIFSVPQTGQFQKFGDVGRLAGQTQNINGASQWTNREAFAFLKGFKSSDDDFAALIDGLRANITPGKTAPKQKALINFLEKQSDNLLMTLPTDVTTSEFLLMIDQFLGEGSALLGRATFKGIPRNNLLNQARSLNVENIVDDIGWDIIQKAAQSKQVVRKNASDYAAEFAINDIMPFIDTHQTRSQFSEHLRGFLPFWYANENFLKRWTLMMTKDGPLGAAVLARKLILTQNGLRTMGIIRKDAQGKDYFVYPGSDLFIDVVGKLPFMGELMSAQAMLQTPTDKLVPGFSTTNFGAPGLTPLVGVSMNVIGGMLQEVPVFNDDVLNTYDDLKTAILGDQQQDRKFYEYILPSTLINTWGAMTNTGVGKERIASAAMSAIAHLEATGNGLKDGASAAEADQFIRDVRSHARIIVLSQALAGWFTPGPASGLQTTEDQSSISWLTEGKIENPAELLSAEYYSLISSLGIEEGTQKYLELYKTNTIHDVINPSAYTVSKTETAGKAVMPGTEEARQFYINNKEIIDSYPTAGAWLLPQANEGSNRSKHAYDSEIINGFRDMKTPEAFLNEVKFKEASHDYFKAKNNYEIKINELNANGDFSLAKQYSADWDRQSVIYKSSHPIFTQYLETGDARQRRDSILSELRYAFDDPQFPKAAHFDGMKQMLTVFDEFVMQKRRLGLSGSGMSKVMRTELEQSFIAWAENHIKLNPGVETFYNTVIQPEAGL